MQTDFDAIIIGAGPAGSTAAILLAEAGWSVALIEKQRFPRRKVCGECIAASNLPLLDALGVGDAFAALAGLELRRVALMRGEETITADLPASSHPAHRWGRALGREHLDTLLLLRAKEAGASLLQPWSALSLRGQPGRFECDVTALDDGQSATLRAPLAIAAHGSWEPLPADRAARRAARRASDLFAFKANFGDSNLAEGLLPVLAFRGGYGGMVVADHGIATLACCIREDRLAACRKAAPGKSAGEVVEDYLQSECAGVRDALRGAVRQEAWLGSGPIRPGIRMPRDGGDVLLIGNAAGEAHPIVGEGMSMAMQSAWLLCERLIRQRDAPLCGDAGRALRREYAIAWRRNFAPRIRLAAWLSWLAMRPALGVGLSPLLRTWPTLLTQVARLSGKVRCAADPATIACNSHLRDPHFRNLLHDNA